MFASLATALMLAGMQWMCPARFSPVPGGWVQGSLGPSTVSASTWVHTKGFSNLNDIPRGGIYIWTLLNPHDPTSPAPTARRPLRLPLRLSRAGQVSTQEGSPLPEYRFAGRFHGYWVDVRVDFGRRRPTAAMRRRADAALAGLRLPAGVARTPSACFR